MIVHVLNCYCLRCLKHDVVNNINVASNIASMSYDVVINPVNHVA